MFQAMRSPCRCRVQCQVKKVICMLDFSLWPLPWRCTKGLKSSRYSVWLSNEGTTAQSWPIWLAFCKAYLILLACRKGDNLCSMEVAPLAIGTVTVLQGSFVAIHISIYRYAPVCHTLFLCVQVLLHCTHCLHSAATVLLTSPASFNFDYDVICAYICFVASIIKVNICVSGSSIKGIPHVVSSQHFRYRMQRLLHPELQIQGCRS